MVADPTLLYRLRDGVYAPDLLVVAVAELDLFTWLAGHGPASTAAVAAGLGLAERPADVMPGAVLERPPVETAARTLLAERGYAGRIEVISADMFTAPLPAGFDLHLFSHVLHDWGEEQVRSLLAASYAALPPGGFLVDHDLHVNEAKTGPLAAAEYSVLLMHSTPGKCWSSGELERMLLDTGFAAVTCRETAADRSALIARKPVAEGPVRAGSMGG